MQCGFSPLAETKNTFIVNKSISYIVINLIIIIKLALISLELLPPPRRLCLCSVHLPVGWFVSRITHKLLNRFP